MLKSKISIIPAFDYEGEKPELERYGISCARLLLEVTGDKGAITFTCFTNWYLDKTIKRLPKICLNHKGKSKTLQSQILQIHSIEDSLDEDKYMIIQHSDYCNFTQNECYVYCIGVDIEEKLATLLVEKGSEAVFMQMAEIYNKAFNTREILVGSLYVNRKENLF